MAEETNQSQRDEFYLEDLDVAINLAKETDQKVLLIFSSSWCSHCRNLRNDLLSIEGFDGKIICILDFDKNKSIATKYAIKSLPTSIILDDSSKELKRLSGYNKLSYEKWLKANK